MERKRDNRSSGWLCWVVIPTTIFTLGAGLNLLVPTAAGIEKVTAANPRWPIILFGTILDALLIASLLSAGRDLPWKRVWPFWRAVLTTIAIWYALRWGGKALLDSQSAWLDVWGTVSGVTALGLLLFFVASSRKRAEQFLAPLRKLATTAGPPLVVAMSVVPLRVGLVAYELSSPAPPLPILARVEHPPSYPDRYHGLRNPWRNPEPAEVERFLAQVKEDTTTPVGRPSQLSDPLIQQLRRELASGDEPNPLLARQALVALATAEGRVLYELNCRPCHGSKGTGTGPMARGLLPPPTNFREMGTIDSVPDEGYLLWRIEEGGLGLPPESTPWDSAMPAWKHDFDPDDPHMRDWLWKILLGMFDAANKTPPESTTGQPLQQTAMEP